MQDVQYEYKRLLFCIQEESWDYDMVGRYMGMQYDETARCLSFWMK